MCICDLCLLPTRLALKARINSQNAFGEALQSAYKRIKSDIEGRETDLDQDIKVGRTSRVFERIFTESARRPDYRTTYNSWFVEAIEGKGMNNANFQFSVLI